MRHVIPPLTKASHCVATIDVLGAPDRGPNYSVHRPNLALGAPDRTGTDPFFCGPSFGPDRLRVPIILSVHGPDRGLDRGPDRGPTAFVPDRTGTGPIKLNLDRTVDRTDYENPGPTHL